jgi:hypothetical protein
MMAWINLLFPLLIWLLHFATVYIGAEFAPAGLPLLTPVATVIAILLLAAAVVTWKQDALWRRVVINGGVMVSTIAIIWQVLPVYLS